MGVARPRAGMDAGDHPPITPARASNGSLSGDEGRVYAVVTRHFLASVSPDCRYLTTVVHLECGGESFEVTGRRITDPGWTLVAGGTVVTDIPLPPFTEGEVRSI